MKKITALALALFLAAALTACGHRHTVDDWQVDYIGHWHVCTECGEKTDYTGHEFGSDEKCIVCNSTVIINSNGNTVVTVYGEDGEVLREIVFDKNGNIIN